MRNLILLFFVILSFLGILTNCTTDSKDAVINNNAVLAQTKDEEKEKKKQGSKLYPYYLDYQTDLAIDGEKLNPILIAVDSFKKDNDIPERKKNLSKYNFELRQDEDFFFVIMNAKRDTNKTYNGGETEDGIDITYFVSKKDGNVKRIFHK